MTRIQSRLCYMLTCLWISGLACPAMAADGFTQADRERMVRVEATLTVFMQQVDKRFEQVDKRFEQMDKRFEDLRTDMNTRFEQVDKRFEDIRTDMNTRFEQADKRFEDIRTDMNKRFEEHRNDMNTRFEQMSNMFYALSAIFTTLFAAVFSFAWWDRRSILITARKTAREEVEEARREDQNSRNTLSQLIEALKNFAEKAPDLKESMRRFNLL